MTPEDIHSLSFKHNNPIWKKEMYTSIYAKSRNDWNMDKGINLKKLYAFLFQLDNCPVINDISLAT